LEQLDFDLEEILYISAKVGTGVQSVFQAIIERIPPPASPTINKD
jgi:translation elongation factor EF-4